MTVTATLPEATHSAGKEPAVSRRRSGLPFSPWHLLLAPLALLFALPLTWLLLSSVMSDAEINRFPPALWPSGIDLGGYRYVLGNALFPIFTRDYAPLPVDAAREDLCRLACVLTRRRARTGLLLENADR